MHINLGSYFKNGKINRLNTHHGLLIFGDSILTVFGALYFLSKGIPITTIFLFFAAKFLFRGLLRPFSLKIIERIGLKKSIITGSGLYALLFPILILIDGINIWFLVFLIVESFEDIFYWLSYHTYYAKIGTEKNRGKETAIKRIFMMIVGSASPFISGFMIEYIGFYSSYILSMIMVLAAIIPLLKLPEIMPKKILFKKVGEISKRGAFIYVGWAFLHQFHNFMWIFVMYFIVKNYSSFGALVALETVLIGVLYLISGKYIDKGNGKQVLIAGGIILTLAILYRTFIVNSVQGIIISEIFVAIGTCLFIISTESVFYNISKRSKNPLLFQFMSETGWDIGSSLAFFVSFFLVAVGIELKWIMPFAIIGLIIVYLSIRNHTTKDI